VALLTHVLSEQGKGTCHIHVRGRHVSYLDFSAYGPGFQAGKIGSGRYFQELDE
jgi:hypothetical protein